MNIGYYIMPPMNIAQSRKKGAEMGFNALNMKLTRLMIQINMAAITKSKTC